jgi:hypothetical protein
MIKANPEGTADVLSVSFPQVFQSCDPYFGKSCAYKKICFGNVQNPLEEGWSFREPHHQLELEQQQQQQELV